MRVYTAVFSNFDRVRSPKVIDPKWDYTVICNPRMGVPAPWEMSVRPYVGDGRRSSRYYKINAHKSFPNDSITVWHGGNVQLRTSPDELVDILGDNDIAALLHSQRTSVYHEGDICVSWKKDNPGTIKSQMGRYKKDGFPGTPLHAAFLLVRRNTDRIAELNEFWWEEVSNGSIRDQLSFDYSCWKLGVSVSTIPGDIFVGRHFKRYPVHNG